MCVKSKNVTLGTTNEGSYSSDDKHILISTSLIYYVQNLCYMFRPMYRSSSGIL
jgi:hypothetical protein